MPIERSDTPAIRHASLDGVVAAVWENQNTPFSLEWVTETLGNERRPLFTQDEASLVVAESELGRLIAQSKRRDREYQERMVAEREARIAYEKWRVESELGPQIMSTLWSDIDRVNTKAATLVSYIAFNNYLSKIEELSLLPDSELLRHRGMGKGILNRIRAKFPYNPNRNS